MEAFRCNPEVSFADLAAEQAQVREALAEIREVLELRGATLRASLALAIAVGKAEQALARVAGEPSWDETGKPVEVPS